MVATATPPWSAGRPGSSRWTSRWTSMPGSRSEALADTVDYSRVAEAIVAIGTGEPHHLLESLARRMLDAVRERFPRIRRMQIELRKLNPPTCPGHPAYAAVRLVRSADPT